MNTQDCPACGERDAVEEETDGLGIYEHATTCKCEECGARFEIDPEADWTGDGWQDTSSVGNRIEDK